MKKRLILSLLLVISSLASFAYDAYVDGIYYNLTSSKQTATVTYENSNYSCYTGSVVIPETFIYNDVEYRVTSIGSSAFRSSPIVSVTIPNSVTSIGNSAFSSCSALTSITIPNSVTSIGSSAFSSCSALTSITIPNSVTSIGNEAFWGCSALSSVIIPNSITSIEEHAFHGCSSLTSVTIPSSVTSIGINPFAGCSSLTSLKVEEGNLNYCSENDVLFNKAKTELISCAGAKHGPYTIPGSVSVMGERAFYGCSNLTSITIPNSVTSISLYAFYGCSSLTSVTIPNTVTSIELFAFWDCSGLTSILIPNSVTKIGDGAFHNCNNIKSVYIENLEAWCKIDFVSSGSNPLFYGYGKLYLNNGLVTDLVIPSSITKVNNYAFQNCKNITSVTIPNSVTSIGKKAFYGCSNLASVTIGSSVSQIYDSAFGALSSSFKEFYCNAESVPSASTIAFKYTSTDPSSARNATLYVPSDLIDAYKSTVPWNEFGTITSIELEMEATAEANQFKTDNSTILGKTTATVTSSDLTAINKTLDDYEKLSEAAKSKLSSEKTLLDNLKKKAEELVVTAEVNQFKTDNSTILGKTTSTIKSSDLDAINKALEDYDKLSETTKSKLSSEKTLLDNLKAKAEELQSGIIDSGSCGENVTYTLYDDGTLVISGSGDMTDYTDIPSIPKIPWYKNRDVIKKVLIEDGVTSIGDNVFRMCSNLSSVTIPNSVTSIGNFAFGDCSSITSFTIQKSVTNIGYGVFSGCSALTSLSVDEENLSYCSIDNVIFNKDMTELICCAVRQGEYTIPNSVTNIGNRAFLNCSGLTSIEIPNSVTNIDYGAFYGCPSLTSVTIGNSVTSIGDNAFDGCSGLTSVTIPNSVTNIGKHAFSNCSGLTSITIGSSVTSIDFWGLPGGSQIKEIYSLNPTPPEIRGYWTLDETFIVFVPAEAVLTYKKAYGWRDSYEILPMAVPVETIAISGEGVENSVISMIEGKIAFLSAALTPTNATDKNVTWASSNETIATVNNIGVVTAIAIGEATITVTSSNGKTANCKVIVTEDYDKTANNFKTAYAEILGKSTTDITSSDLDAINKALDDYSKLSDAAKEKLTIAKNLLDSLKQKAEELNADEETDKKATDEANKFKIDNNTILDKTTSTVASSDFDAINKALDDYSKLSDEAKEKLTNGEKALLDVLKAKAEELKAAIEEEAKYATLTYKIADQGGLGVVVKKGEVTLHITAEECWTVASLTVNGQDNLADLADDKFTFDIQDDAIVAVTYKWADEQNLYTESDTTTGIITTKSNIKAYTKNGQICIESNGAAITLYTINGAKIAQNTPTMKTAIFTVPAGTYIVKVGNEGIKIVVE